MARHLLTACAMASALAACAESTSPAPASTPTPTPTPAEPKTWIRQFGTESLDQALAVATDASGNAYVVGTTDGILGRASSGGGDAFVAKYDPNGTKLWAEQIGLWGRDIACGVATDASGNALVVGEHDASGEQRGFRAEYGPDGTETSSSFWVGSAGWSASAIATDGSGNAFVVGERILAGSNDAIVEKFYADGNLAWYRALATQADEAAIGVATDGSGNAYVVGTTNGALPGQTHSGEWDWFIATYDRDGNRSGIAQFGSGRDDSASGVATDLAGNVVVVGTQNDCRETFVVKANPSMSTAAWSQTLATDASTRASDVASDRAGNFFVVGYTNGSLDGQPNAGDWDVFVVKYSPDGRKLWSRQFGTPGIDMAYGVATDADGYAYVAGWTEGALGQGGFPDGSDAFLMRIAPDGTAP